MAKKLLSPELNQVLKDIENAREAINEKYSMVGYPSSIPSPLTSHNIAEAIRAITSIGDVPELDGTIELAYNEKCKELPSGYYKNGINTKLKDYAVSYIWNRQGIPAKTQYVNINESFTIPDFGVTEIDGNEFKGWSHMPNDEDPEYLTGDIVNHFQYESRLEDPQYISYLYAVWELLKLTPIELSFEYENDGKLSSSSKEIVKMKVNGQRLDYPNLQRKYEIQGNPQVVEDIETGDVWYKHQFTFNQVGIYPIIVTHIGKNGDTETAAGVIKIAGKNGSMSDNGSMDSYKNKGSWYDSGWVSTSIMKGAYISSLKFEVKFTGHSGGTDALAIFIKKTNGSTYIIYDFGNTQIRPVDITNLGTTSMITGNPEDPLVFGSVTLQREDLKSTQHYVPGPSATNLMNFTKDDDIRQARFFVFSSHDTPTCFDDAIINYDINYEFDMGLLESDENVPSEPEESGGGSTPTVQPIDMRLSSLSITPGVLSPTFDKDSHNYTLTVPTGTSNVSIKVDFVDDRTECQVNGMSNKEILLKPSNGPAITQLVLDVIAGFLYSDIPRINGNCNNGNIGQYIVNIVEKSSIT